MSTFSKVLLFINLFVALFLFFLAATVVQHRTNWMKKIDELKQTRDGIQTDPLLAELDLERRRLIVEELSSRFYRQSTHGRRQQGAEGLTQDKPLSEEAQKFLKLIGPGEYKRLLQKKIKEETPKLIIEERELATRKALLAGLRHDYEREITELQGKIALFNERIKEEQDYEKRTQAENADRRRELALLHMELEEAVAARNLAQSQERDMKNYLELTRKHAQELQRKNRDLGGEMARKEGVR